MSLEEDKGGSVTAASGYCPHHASSEPCETPANSVLCSSCDF